MVNKCEQMQCFRAPRLIFPAFVHVCSPFVHFPSDLFALFTLFAFWPRRRQAVQDHAPGPLRRPRHLGVPLQADHARDSRVAVRRAAGSVGSMSRRKGHVGGHALRQERSPGRERQRRAAGLVVHGALPLLLRLCSAAAARLGEPLRQHSGHGRHALDRAPGHPGRGPAHRQGKARWHEPRAGTSGAQPTGGQPADILQEPVAAARQPVPSARGRGPRASRQGGGGALQGPVWPCG